MNAKRAFALAAFGLSLSAFAVAPRITNVRLSADDGPLTVKYDLSGIDAVVTADVLTNGVSIGIVNFTNMTGAVNCRVAVGTDKTIRWRSRVTWPGHKLDPDTLSVRLTAWSVSDPPDYHVTDLATGDIRYYVSQEAFPGGFWDEQYRTTKLVMKKVSAAMKPFLAGAREGELGINDRQRRHKAMLTNDFYIGVFEFTQGQWMTLCKSKQGQYYTSGETADAFTFDDTPDAALKPVNHVCGYMLRGDSAAARGLPVVHAVDEWSLCGKLRSLTGQPLVGSMGFDLPSETEWEFACRAESMAALPNNLKLTNESACPNLNLIAWYAGNGGSSSTGPKPVGSYLPNGYGLYDMVGNVSEYCRGWFLWSLSGVPEVDYEGPKQSDVSASETWKSSIPARGGNYNSVASGCRPAVRVCPKANALADPVYGFRLSLRLP